MPLPLAASSLASSASLDTVAKWGALVALVVVVRRWSAGYALPALPEEGERDLAGRTFILTGGFSSTGLHVFQSLAARGAQIIALHPTPLAPKVVQLLLLLRSATSNERLYADTADLSSLESIRQFAKQWSEGAREGMMGDLEARVDGIVFCDGDGDGTSGVDALGWGAAVETVPVPSLGGDGEEPAEVEKYRFTRLTARLALVQLLLPALLRTASTSSSPVRIVSVVSPFYGAAGPAGAFAAAEEGKDGRRRREKPWVEMGRTALASVVLWRELQRRVSSASTSSSSSSPAPSGAAAPSAPLLFLSVTPGLTRSTLASLFRASPSHPLGLAVFVLLFPLVWLFGKSPEEASQGVIGACVGEVERERGGEEKAKRKEAGKGMMRVRGGALYREGKEVPLPLLDALPPSLAGEIYAREAALVEKGMAALAAGDKWSFNIAPPALFDDSTGQAGTCERPGRQQGLDRRDFQQEERREAGPTGVGLPELRVTALPVWPSSSSTAADSPKGRRDAPARPTPATGVQGLAGQATQTPTPTVRAVSAGELRSGVEANKQGEKRREEEGEREREKRWEGWDTSTTTVYVTNTDEVPTAITLYTTYGESPVVNGGTTVETVYKGADTVTVLGPSYLTLTFYPTTTTYSTSRTTIPTTTKTKTKTPAAQSTATICKPGDADEKEFTGLRPTHDQTITLLRLDPSSHPILYAHPCTNSIVGIAIGWNLFVFRHILYPFKVFTVAVHEVGHVLPSICLGYRIALFVIDPIQGGLTRVALLGGDEHPMPFPALPMGYVFSILVGGLFTFCGFDTLASKVASFIIGLCWIGVFFRVEVFAKLMTLAAVGLMVGLWFVDHAWGLRWYVLFLGVMNSFYVLWDVADDAFFAKPNPSCPAQMFQALPSLSPGIWTIIWSVVSFVCFVGFILAALATWKQSPHAMYCQAQTFLPTR
ncbi:hypothetical protein JCM10207_001190 [Rhodosporidiobolus poonsookiae]